MTLTRAIGFGFNDIESGREAIKSGDLRVGVVSDDNIGNAMTQSGIDQADEKWKYIERESRPRGKESILYYQNLKQAKENFNIKINSVKFKDFFNLERDR